MASFPSSLPRDAVLAPDRLPSTQARFNVDGVAAALGRADASMPTVDVLAVLLRHSLVSRAGELGGVAGFIVHAEASPF